MGDDDRRSTHNDISDATIHGDIVQVGTHTGSLTFGSPRPAAYLIDPERWPIAEKWEPTVAGVHKARSVGGDDGVPPYVERDIDVELRSRLAAAGDNGGMVLLVGDSAAGKTRTAFEAVRAVLPRHRVATPTTGPDVPIIVETATNARVRCVLWLDELDLFLEPGGIDPNIIAVCKSAHLPIIGTIRAQRFNDFTPTVAELRDPTTHQLARQIARIGARVLELADSIEIRRLWSTEEVERVRGYSDERLSDAAANPKLFGVAEQLAAGPKIWSEWRRSFDIGAQPRGTALVSAAVDLARAGLRGPHTEHVINELHERYLEMRGGTLLRPESLSDAWEWATRTRFGVSGPLLPGPDGRWSAFDYLVDNAERLPSWPPVPDFIWSKAAQYAGGEAELLSVAARAAETGSARSFAVAESIWRPMLASPGQVLATIAARNMGILCTANDRLDEAKEFYTQAINGGDMTAAFNLSALCRDAGDVEEARRLSQLAADNGYAPAYFQIGFDLEERGLLDEAEECYRRGAELNDHRSATNLGNLLSRSGRQDEAQPWYRQAHEAGDEYAAFNIGVFHHQAGRLENAEHWYKIAIEQHASASAALNLGLIRKRAGDQIGAARLFHQAFDGGIESAARNLGALFSEAGDDHEAEGWFRRGAESGDLPSMYALNKILYKSGRIEETIPWFERLAEHGEQPAIGALGEILYDLGRLDEAIRYLTTAAEAGNLDSAYNLGVIFEHRDDSEQAMRWFRQSAEGGDSEAAATVADLLFREGRIRSALWWIRRARALRSVEAAPESEHNAS